MPNYFTDFEMFMPPQLKGTKYRSFILRLAEEFKACDLAAMKFYLEGSMIGTGTLERLPTALDVFSYLQRRDFIGPEKLDELRNFLEAIGRPYMIAMVDEFDDSSSGFPLKPKSDNFLQSHGYRLSIVGGRHFETTDGEFVEVKSGANYALTITNLNCHRCICMIKIDDHDISPGFRGFQLCPNEEMTIERPAGVNMKFKLITAANAPAGAGINKWRTNENGVVQAVFMPEKADMQIICDAKNVGTQVLTCSRGTTDSDFHDMVVESFAAASATILINGWKPLGKIGANLAEYGIQHGSRVQVNLGGRGGWRPQGSLDGLPTFQKTSVFKMDPKWRAGATTLENESQQSFMSCNNIIELDVSLQASLNLRLVAREDEGALPSSCTPLARATLIPPPVPNIDIFASHF